MTRVAIIGGGCAGLGAAATLLANSNADVCIVEALGRIGGRTVTYSDTLPVDLGAEAIESPDSNPWLGIAEMLDIETVPANQDFVDYRIFGDNKWSYERSTPGIDLVNATLEVGYLARRESPNLPIIGSSPDWGETPPQMVSLALGSSSFASIKESAEPWQFLAADMYRQEQLSIPDETDPLFVTGGIGGLVAAYAAWLQNKYGKRLEVRLNAAAEGVDSVSGKVRLQTGTVIDSDYCIVTAPVSTVLQIAFTPPLGFDRISALRTLRLGSYKKVGFRPTDLPTAEGEEIEATHRYYIHDPELGGSWQYGLLPSAPAVLLCVASGNFAARLDQMPDSAVWASLVELLGKALPSGNFTPRNGSDNQPEVAVSNWTKTDYIRGAYSYSSYDGGPPDDPFPLIARFRIAKPHGRAYFAGEAAWAKNYGTIAGAYLSGQTAAQSLIQDHGLAGVQ